MPHRRTDRQTERTSVRIAADVLVLNAMTQDDTKERILHSVHVWLSFEGLANGAQTDEVTILYLDFNFFFFSGVA